MSKPGQAGRPKHCRCQDPRTEPRQRSTGPGISVQLQCLSCLGGVGQNIARRKFDLRTLAQWEWPPEQTRLF